MSDTRHSFEYSRGYAKALADIIRLRRHTTRIEIVTALANTGLSLERLRQIGVAGDDLAEIAQIAGGE